MSSRTTALSVAIASALLASAASADVIVYGKANVGLFNIEDEWELTSNASRVGFKGDYTINDELTAVYKMEYQVNIDDGDKDGQTFTQRNIYAGLKGSWGQVIAGKFDTSLKEAQGKIDRFNDMPSGDIKNVFVGENRMSNSVRYTTPKMGCFSAQIQPILQTDESSYSASANVDCNGFKGALAYDNEVKGFNTVRLAGQQKLGAFDLGAMVQSSEDAVTGEEFDGYLVSAGYKINKAWSAYAQFASSDMPVEYDMTDSNDFVGVGVARKLGKKAKLFINATNVSWQDESGTETDETVAGVGFEVKF